MGQVQTDTPQCSSPQERWLFLAGCTGTTSGASGGAAPTADAAPGAGDAEPWPTARPTSRRASPCEIARHRRRARRRHGRRRRRRRRSPAAVAPAADDPTHRGLDAGGPAGLRHELHAHRHRRRTPTTTRRRRTSTFTTVTPTTLSTPSHRPARRHDRRRRHADPRLLRRPGRRQGRRREPPEGHHAPPRPTASWNWMNDSEVHFRPSTVLAGEHHGHPRREPLRRELRRRHLGREEPLGVLHDRRQARLRRRRRQRTPSPSPTATRSCRPTR